MSELIKFFGVSDREKNDPNGKVISAYPAWFYDEKIDNLENDIIIKEHKLKNGTVPTANIEMEKTAIKERKERLKTIVSSKPKLTAKEKDEVSKFYKYLKDQIINRLPSRSDIQKGTVEIRSEVMWKKKPSIDISSYLSLCESLALVRPDPKRITGHQAMLSLRILGKLLGEETNIERLRRDFNSGTYRSDVSLDDLVKTGQGMTA